MPAALQLNTAGVEDIHNDHGVAAGSVEIHGEGWGMQLMSSGYFPSGTASVNLMDSEKLTTL